MEKKNLDWANLGFGYTKTDYRWQSEWKNGAWDEGGIHQAFGIGLCVPLFPELL